MTRLITDTEQIDRLAHCIGQEVIAWAQANRGRIAYGDVLFTWSEFDENILPKAIERLERFAPKLAEKLRDE